MRIIKMGCLILAFVLLLSDANSQEQNPSLYVQTGHTGTIFSIALSPNGKFLVTGSEDGTVKVWDIETRRELRTLKGHNAKVYTVAVSPDGKIIASGGRDKTIRFWDAETGKSLRIINQYSFRVLSIAFSPDGESLASGYDDGTMILWKVATGDLSMKFQQQDEVMTVAFSPDGKLLATGGEDANLRLWKVESGQIAKTLSGHSSAIYSIKFSSDSKIVASGSHDQTVMLWDVETGKVLKSLEMQVFGNIKSIAFSPDNKFIVAVKEHGDTEIWDVEAAKRIKMLHENVSPVSAVVFLPYGKTIVTGNASGEIRFWNAETGQQIGLLPSRTSYPNSVALSPDGKMILVGDNDGYLILWNLEGGDVLKAVQAHGGSIDKVAFSPDGKTIASYGVDRQVNLWNAQTLKLIKSFDEGEPFSDRNKEIQRQISRIVPDFFRDKEKTILGNKFQIKEGENGKLNLFEIKTDKLVASLITLGEREWAVVTPDGLFDGSTNSWKQLSWRLSDKLYDVVSIEAFFKEFYYPGLLQEIMQGKHPRPPDKDLSQVDIRQPILKISAIDNQASNLQTSIQANSPNALSTNQRTIKVKVEISDNTKQPSHQNFPQTSGAQDVRLFRNGSLVKVWHGDVLKGQNSTMLEATIPIVAGENKLTAYAFNHDNIKSSDATLIVNGADSLKRPGTAYVLAVGVNSYSNPNYNLKYAVADAEDFSAEFKRQQETLKNYERIEVIPLYDKQATKANIFQTLSQLATKAQPEDAVIVYFSGHGTAQQQRFYLIPSDLGYQGERTKLSAADLRTILEHSISDRELEQAFEKIDAGQLLTVIDACNSGQALDAEEKRRGPMNSKGLAQLAYEKGMYILTAAQSYQAALEASRIGHGYLTYALVEEGLKQGKADREPQDNQIVLREWLDYATERVPQMQEEKMKETPQVKDQQGRQLEMVFVEGDENITDPAKRSVQTPRVFYRRETEALPLIIARPQTTPAKN